MSSWLGQQRERPRSWSRSKPKTSKNPTGTCVAVAADGTDGAGDAPAGRIFETVGSETEQATRPLVAVVAGTGAS